MRRFHFFHAVTDALLTTTAALSLASMVAFASPAIAQEDAVQETAATEEVDLAALPPEQREMLERLQNMQTIEGPATVDVGSEAELNVPEGFNWYPASDAQAYLQMMGNLPDSSILGLLEPQAEDKTWFITFSFSDIGYIKDADKEKIDADELMDTFQAGIEPGNSERRAMGLTELRAITWSDPPFYDEETKNLTWGIDADFGEDGHSINYEIRMLGRGGVMSATLIADPESYKATVPEVKTLLAGYHFDEGARYADWKPGDKVAAIGLAGLIGGGGLAVAAKTGLLAKLGLVFAKAGKAIIIGVIAVGAGLMSVIKRFFGGGSNRSAY